MNSFNITSRALAKSLQSIRRCSYLHKNRFSVVNTPAPQPLKSYVLSQTLLLQPSFHQIDQRFFTAKSGKVQKPINIIDKLTKLKEECEAHNRVNFATLNDIASSTEISTLAVNDVIFMLKCCENLMPDKLPHERHSLFEKLWKLLDADTKNNPEFLKLFLQFHAANRIQIQDFEIENILKRTPSVEIYHELINAFCEVGDINNALEIISKMKENNFPITEISFNALITGYSRCQNIEECENTMDTMVTAGLQPSIETYWRVLCGLIENGEIKKAEMILKSKISLFSNEQVLSLIKCAAFTKKSTTFLPELLKHLPDKVLSDPEIHSSLRNTLIELLYKANYDEIHMIINELPKPSFQLHQNTDAFGTFIISEMFKSNTTLDEIIKFTKLLIDTGKNERALHIACEISLRREMSYSESLLRELSKREELRCHYFWPLIVSEFKKSRENGVLRVIQFMKELKIPLDFDTVKHNILPKLPLNLEDPKRMMKILEEKGLSTGELLTPLLSDLINQGRLQEAINLTTIYPTKIDSTQLLFSFVTTGINMRTNRNEKMVAKLLNIINQKSIKPDELPNFFIRELIQHPKMRNEFPSVKFLLREFKNNDLKLSNVVGDNVLNYFSKSTNGGWKKEVDEMIKLLVDKRIKITSVNENVYNIAHPRDMNYNELLCHLTELEAKKLNPRGILRRLLQLAVREGRLEEAVTFKKKCDEHQVYMSPGMLASILEMYIRMKNFEEAHKTLSILERDYPGFSVDSHKIIDLASLQISLHNLDGATKLLKKHAAKTVVKDGAGILKNIWSLLNNIALNSKNTEGNRTLEMLELLTEHNYCTMNHNTLLGPVIREYIIKYEINLAVETFKTFVEKYKKTPLQLEIMTILVKISNLKEIDAVTLFNMSPDDAKNHLQNIINLASTVHGLFNTHITLILALADSGTESQLRKLLINPETKFDAATLMKHCEHLVNLGKIDVLLKIAKCARGIQTSFNENELYQIILSYFDRENNCDAAILLFDRLSEDEDIKITKEFAKNLENLFSRNSIDVPTKVRLYAN